MPKLKTNRGAAKRFKISSSGRIKRAQANRRHILSKKPTKRKRHLRGTTSVATGDQAAIRTMLPYA